MNRREFLRNGGLLGAGAALFAGNQVAKAAAPSSDDGALTFSLFADIHYAPHELPHDSREWLERILDRALKEKAEFVIHLGDFTHHRHNTGDYVKAYNDFSIPTYHVIGNHDTDGRSYKELLGDYQMKNGYYFFDRKGFRFVVLDANYFKRDKQYVHYIKGNYGWAVKQGAGPVIPPDQIEWLKDVLDKSPYPCILMSHQSIEREGDGLINYLQVRDIINNANKKHPGRVPLVMNGHYHTDYVRILDGVVYFDVNSANYYWVDKKHNLYPKEFEKNFIYAKNTIAYNDPISAIVTLWPNGRIRVKGQNSTLYKGVTRKMTGNGRFDMMGREATARIQSFDLTPNW